MIPIVVTACMVIGIAHASPWTPTLDGILAAELWHETKRHQPPPEPALDQSTAPPERSASPRAALSARASSA